MKPYHINIPSWALPLGKQSNEVSQAYDHIPIQSLRGMENKFQLDKQGFQITKETERGQLSLCDCLKPGDFADREKVKSFVRPAVEDFVKRALPDAENAFAFSTQV